MEQADVVVRVVERDLALSMKHQQKAPRPNGCAMWELIGRRAPPLHVVQMPSTQIHGKGVGVVDLDPLISFIRRAIFVPVLERVTKE